MVVLYAPLIRMQVWKAATSLVAIAKAFSLVAMSTRSGMNEENVTATLSSINCSS